MTKVDNLDVAAVLQDAEKQGVKAYVLRDITDYDAFFNAIRAQFPQDPLLVSNRSWDALLDSVRGGLHEAEDRRVAIVWPQPEVMIGDDSRETALSVLAKISADLAHPGYTQGKPTEVTIVLG
jgi:hypothetical protein